jgi:hypothetical protein
VRGDVLVLDADLEGAVQFPATAHSGYDGKPHSCVPEHHSCIKTLYQVSYPPRVELTSSLAPHFESRVTHRFTRRST